ELYDLYFFRRGEFLRRTGEGGPPLLDALRREGMSEEELERLLAILADEAARLSPLPRMGPRPPRPQPEALIPPPGARAHRDPPLGAARRLRSSAEPAAGGLLHPAAARGARLSRCGRGAPEPAGPPSARRWSGARRADRAPGAGDLRPPARLGARLRDGRARA